MGETPAPTARAFGGGKVILLGEHSVVYGQPALAAGLSRGVSAQVVPAETDRFTASPWDVDLRGDDLGAESAESLGRAFAAVREHYPADAVHVHADVDLPGGAGLGCSAALGVAVVGALDAHFGTPRTDEERGAFSLRWERVFHGNPSGVDNAMAACGGVAVFEHGQPLARVQPRRGLPIVIAHSGESSSTKEVVGGVAEQHAKEPERLQELFGAIGALVRNAKLAVQDGDLRALGQLMDMNQALLSAMFVSTEKLEALCRAAREAGALGAKLTGAGGGGCMIALAPDLDAATTIEAALRPLASMTLITEAGS